jgi:hypothetical protein
MLRASAFWISLERWEAAVSNEIHNLYGNYFVLSPWQSRSST